MAKQPKPLQRSLTVPQSRGNLSAGEVQSIYELFVAGEVDLAYLESSPLRPVVVQSWQRSLTKGVDPDRGGGQSSPLVDRIAEMKAAHPLAAGLPVIRNLLVADATEAGAMVAVGAADGTLLWVEGDRRACREAEAMNFVPGADWSECGAGTSAPGTALAIDREIQITQSEHFCRPVQPWSCSAVPIHDPTTGRLLGVIDVSSGTALPSLQTLPLVRATAVAVESQLALLRLSGQIGNPLHEVVRLLVLGVERPQWSITDLFGRARTTSLTARHADILLLLTTHPEGLSADSLAMLLDEKDLDPITVRAEISRLRKVVGADFIASRPYRLLQPLSTDVADVYNALKAENVGVALDHFRGPILPRSRSPAVARMRAELSTVLRRAVLACGDRAVLHRWLSTPEGRDDIEGWRTFYNGAATASADRFRALSRLAALNDELG